MSSINRNTYILKFIPPQERDFLNYLDQLKYEETLRDPDNYFQPVKVINFDIIHHVSRGDPLEKSYDEHFSVKNKNFNTYDEKDKKTVTNSLFRNQKKTKQPLHADKKLVMDHFKK